MPELLEALANELAERIGKKGVGYKHDSAGAPNPLIYSHGPGGLLSYPGVDPLMFHTIVGARGIISELPTKSSVYADPIMQIITGVQDTTGSNKSGVCDNAPQAGLIKACKHHAPFGRYELQTAEIELNRLGVRNDRADPLDLRLVGSPIATSGIFGQGPANSAIPADAFVNEVSRKFFELGVAFNRLLNIQLWAGAPANNAVGGGYKEFPGFQLLVNTGYVDAETNTACPSVDSDVKDFAYGRIDSGSVGTDLVNALSYIYRTRKNLAYRTGVEPVRFVFAMREELFWEITKLWPCSYLTYMCQVSGNQRVNIDGAEQVRMRDEMRGGSYLMLDGEKIQVILDDGIPEASNTTDGNVPNPCFASDIYLIPMSVIGGQQVTFLEYADYGNPSLQSALEGGNMILAKQEGAFLTWPRQTNQCVTWQSKIEPRLVMRTPWLAGRLQHVVYCPLQHTRTPFPTGPGSSYHVDGGVTSRAVSSYFDLW